MGRGRFEGLTDAQWQMIAPLMPADPEKRCKGHPHTPWRQVCNTILWVLITGARWCDVPKGEQWSSRSVAHRWLGRWTEEGILDKLLQALLETADLVGLLNWERMAADGFFFQREGRWRGN